MNPLRSTFDTPYEAVPFHDIKNEHFLPALQEAINEAKEHILRIKTNPDTPTFENTIAQLEDATECVSLISQIFFNLHSAETNDDLEEVAQEFEPLLTNFYSDINFDEELFRRIKSVYDRQNELDLTQEQEVLLDRNYKAFVRNGALLDNANKDILRDIDQQLSTYTLAFGVNALKATKNFALEITDKEQLAGLPDNAIQAAAERAEEQGKSGSWIFTLDAPSYGPFMKYADSRSLREELYKARASIAYKNSSYDNSAIVKQIAVLRYKRAQLLGYSSHAHFVLEQSMAGSREKVYKLLDELFTASRPIAEKEVHEIEEFQYEVDGIRDLQRWDFSYYAEKMKKKLFAIDENILRPYFPLENCIQGVFTVANKLYNLSFHEISTIPVYHSDVKTYEVREEHSNRYIGLLYIDLFPRDGKRQGAWMTSYRKQHIKDNVDHRPHVCIVCNFTPPVNDQPALLSFEELNTLFHEFGHALHGLLSQCQYRSLSCTSVYRDFVELPSQVLENWLMEKECLDLFAIHYQTGETIPADLVDRLKKSSTFLQGFGTIRQLSLGLLDMAWHDGNPDSVTDVGDFETQVMEKTELFPHVPNSNTSCSFGHIFRGGYSAGYYSYKWSEVLDADAFEFFKEKGIFDPEVAQRFKENILSKGGSGDPVQLYKRFRGKEASVDALLRRAGFLRQPSQPA